MLLNDVQSKSLIKLGVGAGLIFALIITTLFYLGLDEKSQHSGNPYFTAFFLISLALSLIIIFKKYSNTHHQGETKIMELCLLGLVSGLTIGIVAGFAQYINVTYFDPDWASKALEHAQENWASRIYSPESIATQVEFTDTFQNPLKWAVQSGIFITFLTIVFSIVIAFLLKAFSKANED